MHINPADRHLAGQARLLRRQGKTYDEIRDTVGWVSNDQLHQWLKGIPRPKSTYRSCPMTELRRQCRQLRAQGMTYGEIAELTGATKGSLSLWLSDVQTPRRVSARLAEHLGRVRGRGALARHERAERERQTRIDQARALLGPVSERDLLVAGAALYWAEGSKRKPWRPARAVQFINADPSVLAVHLAWLDLMGVAEESRSYRLQIHESANVEYHEQWWSRELNVPLRFFRRATLKRHKPVTSRRNIDENYHGCLTVTIARSTALYDTVDGFWQGIAAVGVAARR